MATDTSYPRIEQPWPHTSMKIEGKQCFSELKFDKSSLLILHHSQGSLNAEGETGTFPQTGYIH